MNQILNILKGGALGVAMIIPGVSGGTMALILGIYERLIKAINRMRPAALKEFLPPYPDGIITKWRNAFVRLDLVFLMMLAVGGGVVVLILAKVMPILMTRFHDPTYGFFWGVILASTIIPLKLMKRFTWQVAVAIVLGIAVTASLSYKLGNENIAKVQKKADMELLKVEGGLSTAEASDVNVGHLFYVFFAAAVSMSACILPGISGSFVMLLFGVYFDILEAINRLRAMQFNLPDILLVGSTAAGCLLGLIGFAKFLEIVFRKYHDPTMGILLGLMLGSLYGIWPFKDHQLIEFPEDVMKRADGLPRVPSLDGNLGITIVAALLGIGVVLTFEYIDRHRSKEEAQLEGK